MGEDGMRLWMALYAMIWITFLEFLLVMTPGTSDILLYLHVALGFGIIGLAYYDFSGLRSTAVPGRVKRTAKSTLQLSVAIAVLGVLLVLRIGTDWALLFGITVWGFFLFVHVVGAFAVITQAAAVAMAYDMWEDKEFAKETAPGEVPRMPAPSPSPGPRRS